MTVILVPLDSSRQSDYCLDFYIKQLHRQGNQLHTVYVADYFGDIGVLEGPTPGRIHELEEQDRKKAAEVEAHVDQMLKANNISGSFTRLMGRDPWHTIIEHSKTINADMIVMGSRGMGKIRRTILGSVSESVLHHSEIPVLICKLPPTSSHHH